MSIGKNISLARKNIYMSQSKLARKIGVSPQSVQLWESGKNNPRRSRIKKLAEVLNVSAIDLEFGKIRLNQSIHNYDAYNFISKKEMMLLSRFRKLDEELQDNLILIAETGIKLTSLENNFNTYQGNENPFLLKKKSKL